MVPCTVRSQRPMMGAPACAGTAMGIMAETAVVTRTIGNRCIHEQVMRTACWGVRKWGGNVDGPETGPRTRYAEDRTVDSCAAAALMAARMRG